MVNMYVVVSGSQLVVVYLVVSGYQVVSKYLVFSCSLVVSYYLFVSSSLLVSVYLVVSFSGSLVVSSDFNKFTLVIFRRRCTLSSNGLSWPVISILAILTQLNPHITAIR